MKKIFVAPSILAGDFGHLADEARRIQDAGADAIHIDIMDGQFVPNLTLGPRAVAAINRSTSLFLDVHLMIYNPFDYVEQFIEAGADRITFHLEATEQVQETLDYIHKCGKEAGLSLSPDTSVSLILPYLSFCDLVLLMSVEPGHGGQKFLPDVLEKISVVRTFTHQQKSPKKKDPFLIQVDGGINLETAKQCVEAGANYLVAGTYLFETKDMAKAIQQLKDTGKSS